MDRKPILEIADRARAAGRDALTEVEGLGLLAALGVEAPAHHFIHDSTDVAGLALFPGERAVVKVMSPAIMHKTEVGGVVIVANNHAAIAAAIAKMESAFAGQDVDGYTVNEFVPYEPRLGHEIIIGYRFAPDFGPVVSFGPGGIHTEFLASTFRRGAANVFFSPVTADRALVEKTLSRNAIVTLLCGGLRNTAKAIDEKLIVDAVWNFIEAAPVLAAAGISEFEVNPFVVSKRPGASSGTGARLVALDVLVKLDRIDRNGISIIAGRPENPAQSARPTANIGKILKPASAAIIGVSEKGMNNGRIILRNLIESGFDMKRIYVVKPGLEELDGCRCVPDVASLPEKVDIFILVIPAAKTPETLTALIEADKAWSVIVIPGGLEEKAGTGHLVAAMKAALDRSRSSGGGPLINGGNCLGIRSVPGRYNTLFIPERKLPMPAGKVAPLAIVSQSGAFAICRISKHAQINPKYTITCGNQMDLTIGDYLWHLKDDAEIRIFAVYVEGFKPLDGEKTLAACKAIVDSGRTVVFYRAGRTQAGAGAAASHTASIAGDYPVTQALMEQVGAIVCPTLQDFDDAVTTCVLLEGKIARGNRLGAVSNAGFECVAIADNLGELELARFTPEAGPVLEKIFAEARIGDIVDVHNPIDLTPMADDAAYDMAFRTALSDGNVDCGIVGIVPMSAMMNTLVAAPGIHSENVADENSLAGRYGRLMAETDKPFVASVDAGNIYDPLVRELEKRGVPTFRTADRALEMLNLWLKVARRRRKG